MSELKNFLTWSVDNLNKLNSVSDEEAEQIKIEMDKRLKVIEDSVKKEKNKKKILND